MAEPTVLTDNDETLNRQVPAALYDEVYGPMSSAFAPSSRDESMLSTLRGRVAASEAYRRYTQDLGHESAGTWGIGVGDANALSLGCVDDGTIGDNPVDHASVDFSALSRSKRKTAGRALRDAAGPPLHLAPGVRLPQDQSNEVD